MMAPRRILSERGSRRQFLRVPKHAFTAFDWPMERSFRPQFRRDILENFEWFEGMGAEGPLVPLNKGKAASNAMGTLGPWIDWKESGSNANAYRLLNQPEGRVYLSRAHLSQLPGWQEGAVLAAHRTIELIASRVGAATSTANQ
jgi:hypothetical protein